MRLKTLGPSLIRLAYLGSLLLGLPATAAAAPTSPFTVDSTLDNPDASPGNSLCADSNGACTLRAAVMEANAHVGPDTILLPVDTFHLIIPGVGEDAAAAGDLDLLGQVTLQGAAAGASVIDATGLNDRVIHVLAGAQASLSDLTIRGGIVVTSGEAFGGGGLLNAGSLTLTRVIVTHNNLVGTGSDRYGGGLANWLTGWMALNNSQVISNEAGAGAIFNVGWMAISGSRVVSNSAYVGAGILNAGQLQIDSSQVISNSGALGGGITNYGPLTVINSLIGGNTAVQAAGLDQKNGALAVTGTTIRDNRASLDGGGLVVSSGVVTLTASTLWHNSAGGEGGGVFLEGPGSLTAVNTTIAGNAAGLSGGGIHQADGSFAAYNVTLAGNIADADDIAGGVGGGLYRIGGVAALSNTLLVDNVNPAGIFYVADDCFGAFGTFHYSLVGVKDIYCTFSNDNTLVGANPHLRLLHDNGGPTQTMALGPGSAALDAGDPAGCRGPGNILLLADQRGRLRRVDGDHDGQARCDIGAFEVQLELFLPLLRR